ncbi:MAG TPA: oligoendopeptidase F [Chloroflexia bacterium]|nr:oligoendopeptidase F [Chloroflexia bacterium]
MPTKTLPARADVDIQYKWNLEGAYAEDKLWDAEHDEVGPMLERVAAMQGKLSESAHTLLEALQLRYEISRRVGRLFSYARMRRDEDNTIAHYQAMDDKSRALYTRAQEATSFFNPEMLAIGREKIDAFLREEEGLKIYTHMFDDLFREQEHMLSEREEALLAGAGEMAAGPTLIFEMLTEADMTYGTVTDEEGQEADLTHGRYLRFMQSPDRRLRSEAFHKFLGTYHKFRNTIATCYSTEVKKSIFYAKARKYGSSLEASLSPDNIPVSVYEGLVGAVNDNLHLLHRYMKLRKRVLQVDELHMYDLYVPLVPDVENVIPYDQATRTVMESLAPMGNTYLAAVQEGFESRWTDVYETPNKSSGAYSWAVYGVHPFMLLNYQDTLNDMFTLAHEMGHSIHTYFSHQTQPYIYSDYTLFVAEVASTLNEALLSHHLLKSTDDKSMRLAIVNYSLEQFRTTLFRQTMFAEFEKLAHERAESGKALTAEALSDIHYGLNVKYHGPDVTVDPEIAIEWARIPHFYRNFYVYKYSTGMAAAIALSKQILDEGEPAVKRYISFLSGGSSNYSIDLLKGAGVDMTAPSTVAQALQVFGERIDEMERLLA